MFVEEYKECMIRDVNKKWTLLSSKEHIIGDKIR